MTWTARLSNSKRARALRVELAQDLLVGAVSVVGLARPELTPAVLGDAVFLDERPASIEIVYGSIGTATGSQLRVTTAWRPRAPRPRPSPVALAEALARQLPPSTGASGPLRLDDRPVLLGDRPCRVQCQLGDGDSRWAARIAASSPLSPDVAARSSSGIEQRAVEVTVVARDWSPAELCLDWISDLAPFLAARP